MSCNCQKMAKRSYSGPFEVCNYLPTSGSLRSLEIREGASRLSVFVFVAAVFFLSRVPLTEKVRAVRVFTLTFFLILPGSFYLFYRLYSHFPGSRKKPTSLSRLSITQPRPVRYRPILLHRDREVKATATTI